MGGCVKKGEWDVDCAERGLVKCVKSIFKEGKISANMGAKEDLFGNTRISIDSRGRLEDELGAVILC